MSKIHVLPDENLGGVLREYVEVDRPAKEGDLIVVYDGSDICEDITAGKPYLVHNGGHNYIKFYEDVGDERLWNTPSEDYAVIEPTDIVHIYGKRYRLVNRKAKVGEKVIVFNHSNENGNGVFTVYDVYIVNDGARYVGKDMRYYSASSKDYRVLEPVEPAEESDDVLTVDETEASKSVLDLLANLARRVTKLERENKELRHQSHNHRLDIEQIYIDVKSLRENVDVLDERTQPLIALIKAVKDDG